ncbi:MAG: 3-phosphoshikimate 1-carboxyvinyltransferase [Pyrinomonadaceae bacterium]
MKISPAKFVSGNVALPGDKSITHRAAMIASIAVGETRIENFATSADCASTLKCLEALGVKIRRKGKTVLIIGVGKSGFMAPSETLDCGNSGTTMRLLAGVLAGQEFQSTLTGDESLQKRPMKRIIEPLSKMGAVIASQNFNAPLTISGRSPLRSVEYRPQVASAQIKSCLLLAGLNSDGVTTVIENVQTRDHTERMLKWFGVDVTLHKGEFDTRISVSGDAVLIAQDVSVPSDISAAAFFMVAASCLNGSDITMKNVGLNPSRRAIFDVMQNLGANVAILEASEKCNEPIATIRIRGGIKYPKPSTSVVLSGSIIANLMDEVPILAILGTQLHGGMEIRDAAELRVKESDRIAAIVENLERMGADVTEFPDGFKVERSNLNGAVIDSFGDHRIAMAFAVAGLLADGDTEIRGSKCADISFPGFFQTLSSVVR